VAAGRLVSAVEDVRGIPGPRTGGLGRVARRAPAGGARPQGEGQQSLHPRPAHPCGTPAWGPQFAQSPGSALPRSGSSCPQLPWPWPAQLAVL